MAHLFTPLRQKFYDSNGAVLALGKVYTYEAGTSTPLATYQDKLEASANTNPIILDANGECDLWLKDQAYKIVVKTSADVTVKTVDNISHNNLATITATMLAADVAGVGLSQHADKSIQVNVDDSTIEVSSDALRVKDLGITTGKLADLAVTSAKLAAVPISKLSGTSKFFQATDSRILPLYTWSSPSLLTSAPTSAPAGAATGECAWSPDGKFLAVSHQTTPYLTVYERQKDTFTKLDAPSSLPAGTGQCVAWSPSGEFLVIGHSTTPFFTIYRKSGTTLTKLTNPGTLPAAAVKAVAWSPDGRFLCAGVDRSGGAGVIANIYERSGTTFTKLADPADMPSSTTGEQGIAFSDNGQFLAIAYGNGIKIFTISGSTFTGISNPSGMPTTPFSVAFSKGSTLFGMTGSGSPFFAVYTISGVTFTKMANPATLPANQPVSIDFSPENDFVAVTDFDSPYVLIYSIVGTTLTKQSDLGSFMGAGYGVKFSPDARYLACISSDSPYLQVYKTASAFSVDALPYFPEVLSV